MNTLFRIFMLSLILTILIYLCSRKKMTKKLAVHIYAITLVFVAFFMSFSISSIIWDATRWLMDTFLR